MLSLLICLLKFLNCSTFHSEEINISSNKKKNTDISVYNVRSSEMHPLENVDAGYGVNLHLKQSKMYSNVQPHTHQRNDSSDAEDLSKTSEFHSFQGKNKEKPKYLPKKFDKLHKIPQGNLKQSELMLFDMPESISFNNIGSFLKKTFEKSNIYLNFNPSNEENDCLQNTLHSTLTINKTQAHDVYSISENHKKIAYLDRSFELGDDCFINAKLKMSLKRKNTCQESEIINQPLDLSMKTVQEQNTLEPEPKRICTHKESSNLIDCRQNEEKIIKYTILSKHSNYISKIECLIKEFLIQNKSVETDIDKLLYGWDLLILPDFLSDIFGEWDTGCTNALQRVSTTADMLSKFIDFCKIDTENKLVSNLKDCLKEKNIYTSWTDENIPDFILNEITAFLKSDESLYFKSICTEFYSFVNLFDNLAIKKEVSLVNAFAVFLLLVKRNSIIIYQLKEKVRTSKKDKFFHFIKEKQNSSALLFVFIDNLNFSSSNYIRTNMRTSILYKCISYQFSFAKKHLIQIRMISVLSNIFFYLIDLNIFFDAIEILKSDLSLIKIKNSNQILRKEIIKINARIKGIIVDVSNNSLKITEKMNRMVPFNETLHRYFTNIAEGNNFKLQIVSFDHALDIIYTLLHFKDCNIGRIITNLNPYFYRVKFKKTNEMK